MATTTGNTALEEILRPSEAVKRKMWVRVREPKMIFSKSKLDWPMDAEGKDIPGDPVLFECEVQGHDEMGRPTCPLYQVPDSPEINNAIHGESVTDQKTGVLIRNGRLIAIPENFLDKFPKWIGHPKRSLRPIELYIHVLKIEAEQVKGDAILGLTEPSELYRYCQLDPALRGRFEEGKELAKAAREAQALNDANPETKVEKEEVK